jgi:hypothetical protein
MHKFDQVETCAADRATVGPFHPGCQAFIVQIMTARSKMSNQVVRIFFGGVGGVVDVFGVGLLRDRGGGSIMLWRLGKGRGKCCDITMATAQVS